MEMQLALSSERLQRTKREICAHVSSDLLVTNVIEVNYYPENESHSMHPLCEH